MQHIIARARAMLAALALLGAGPAFADGPGDSGANVAPAPVHAAPVQPAAQPANAPVGQTGQITAANGAFNLNVPAGYRFYPPEVALAYLQRNNAPAPSGTVAGLLAPASANINQPGTWATIVSYDPIGYVRADSAQALTETNFEASVRAARQQQTRVFEGFAIAPAFDPVAAGQAWAERTGAPGGASGADFRHEERLLARDGVAGLTSIGSADQMGAITTALPDLIRMIQFPSGHAYADFQPSTDRASTWNVPSLVTGIEPPPALAETASTGAATQQTAFSGLAGAFPWIAGGVIVLAGAGYLLMRRRRDPNFEPDDGPEDVAEEA